MRKLEIPSPAKVNLYLKVIRRRKDGYHEILTVFERINLLDHILLEKTKKGIRLFSRQDLPLDDNNLAYKAALIFSKKLKKEIGIKISIFKNIPIGAGLGGGSSNAATVLLGLNRLYETGLDKTLLFRWGREIGADVNFFLSERRFALGRGRGEKIYPLDLDTHLWHVLIYPNKAVSTKEVYNSFRIGLTEKVPDVKILLHALKEKAADLVAKTVFNSLAEAVKKKCPVTAFWEKQLLEKGVERVSISGSGSSIFGIVSNRKQAEAVKRGLEKFKEAKIFVVSTY
jgi:4-diphosphocytidyl-2-C-methyl-D-erythritol kinase